MSILHHRPPSAHVQPSRPHASPLDRPTDGYLQLCAAVLALAISDVLNDDMFDAPDAREFLQDPARLYPWIEWVGADGPTIQRQLLAAAGLEVTHG